MASHPRATSIAASRTATPPIKPAAGVEGAPPSLTAAGSEGADSPQLAPPTLPRNHHPDLTRYSDESDDDRRKPKKRSSKYSDESDDDKPKKSKKDKKKERDDSRSRD